MKFDEIWDLLNAPTNHTYNSDVRVHIKKAYKIHFYYGGHLDSRFIDGIVALNMLTVNGVPG